MAVPVKQLVEKVRASRPCFSLIIILVGRLLAVGPTHIPQIGSESLIIVASSQVGGSAVGPGETLWLYL